MELEERDLTNLLKVLFNGVQEDFGVDLKSTWSQLEPFGAESKLTRDF